MDVRLLFLSMPVSDGFFRRGWVTLGLVSERGRGKRMVVYGDLLFFLNLALDYGLLLVTAKVAACPFVRLRLLGASLFGGIYAVLVFVPGLEFLAWLPMRLASGVLLVLLAYGGEPRFFHLLIVFAGVTTALGGIVLALSELGRATFYQGVATTGMDLLAVLLAGAAGCAGLSLFFRRKAAALGKGTCVEVEAKLGENTTRFRALVDTGNTLTDRSNRPVLVVDWQVLAQLVRGSAALDRTHVADPTRGFQLLTAKLPPGRVQLVPYHTVGTADGMLLALRPDSVVVNGTQRTDSLLAGSPHAVSDGGEYQGLVGPESLGGTV